LELNPASGDGVSMNQIHISSDQEKKKKKRRVDDGKGKDYRYLGR